MMVSEKNPYDKHRSLPLSEGKQGPRFANPHWKQFERTKQSYFTNDPLIKEGMVISGEELDAPYWEWFNQEEWIAVTKAQADRKVEAWGDPVRQSVKLKTSYHPKLSDKIGHINCDPEALKDPEFVNAINQMAELAYKKGVVSQPVNEGEGEKHPERPIIRALIDKKVFYENEKERDIAFGIDEAFKIVTEHLYESKFLVGVCCFCDSSNIAINNGIAHCNECNNSLNYSPGTAITPSKQPQTEEKPEERERSIPYSLNQWQLSELKAYLHRRARDFGGIDYPNIDKFLDEYQSDMMLLSHPINQEDKPESEELKYILFLSLLDRNLVDNEKAVNDTIDELLHNLKQKGYTITKTK